MAEGIFGFGAMGAMPDQAAQAKPDQALRRRQIETSASQHQVPANVLLALDEAGISDFDTVARKIAADMKGGKTVDQIVGPGLMNRAYDIADAMYPRAPAPVAPDRPKEASVVRDAPAAIGASVANAAGGAVRGVGEAIALAADGVNKAIANPFIEGMTGQKDVLSPAANPLEAPAEGLGGESGLAGFLDSFVSQEVKQDMADLTDKNADLFSPSTWKMGKRPTVRGAVYSAVDVFGSMAPVVIVGAITRSPAAAAAAGGAMSAGDAAGNAGQVIEAMAANKLPDGRSQLEAESSVYQRLIAEGRTPDQAFQITKRRAAQQSAMLAALPGALGGAATQKILSGAEGLVSKLPWAGRVAGTAALSGAEEGVQEVAEGMSGRAGVNSGAGLNQSVTAGTLNEAVLGALGGGPMGAIGGAFSTREQNTAGDGSAGGQDAALAMGLPGPDAGAASANMPPAPTGPIGRAAELAPDLTPPPEAPPPPSFFPDQKPGSAIKLYDPEAEITHNAVFLGEGPDGVSVRVNGEEILLNPQEFDQARNEAIRLEEEAKAATKGKKSKAKTPAAPVPGPESLLPDDRTEPDTAAADALKEMGFNDGPWNEPAPEPVAGGLAQQAASAVTGPTVAPPVVAITPEEALARAKQIEGIAKDRGWNKRLTKQHADFMAIAGKQNVAQIIDPQSLEPVAGNGGGVAGGGADNQRDAGPASDGNNDAASGNTGVPSGATDLSVASSTGQPSAALSQPRAPVAPMEADPGKRLQPDLLGGEVVTEADMAKKERTRREWGRFLGIAEGGKSSDDMTMDGREVRIRPGKIIFMAKTDGQRSNDDRVIDTNGMSRDVIAAAARGARAVLDRLFDRMTPDAMKHRATSLRQQKALAITKKPELEAQLKKTWPLSDEYEQKRERLQSVIKDLEGASDSARLGDDIGESSESRFDLGAVQPVPVSAMRAVSDALAAEVKASGLEGKVSPALVRHLLGRAGVPIQGRQAGELIEVSAESSDPVGVMRHEIVHALRDEALWGKPYGLFTKAEWQSLVAAARADAGLMARVVKAYAEKSPAVQTEEAVAEMYREWAGARAAAGPVARILGKIKTFFDGMARALRGEGFADAATVMERIAGGTVGGRGPDGGRGNDAARNGKSGAKINESRGERALSSNADEIMSVAEIADLAEKHGRIYVRWSAGPKFDMKSGAKSRDTVSGETHSGLSAVVIRPDFSTEDILKMVRDYGFLRGEKATGAYFYTGDETGVDSDGTPTIAPIKYLGRASDDLVSFADDDSNYERMSLERSIGYGRVALADPNYAKGPYLPAYTPAKLAADEAKLLALGGPVIMPGTAARTEDKEMRGGLIKANEKFKGLVGSAHWKNPGAMVSNTVTDAMVGGNGYNALALVPGRALFAELGKYLPSARSYLRQKEEMDSVRNDWHARADKVAQRWLTERGKNPEANEKLADLMHKSTLSGIDPSQPDTWQHAMDAGARREISERGDEARDWAKDTMRQIAAHEASYAKLKAEYDALPLEFRQLYRTVKGGYDAMGMAFEQAILDNIKNATRVGLKRAVRAHEKEIARIRDEGLEGEERDEAVAAADAKLKAIKMRGGFAAKARLASMRKKFESNRLKGPYFPLARFGEYFVTVRDATGAVTSFSKFEKESQQQAFIREMKAEGETKIEFGTMDDAQKLRGQIDPGFVADIENMLAEAGAGDEVMDAVWQRWLETLPDRSIRTSNIHRKGRTGYSSDAFRAFSKQMFHGGHQLSKLEHGLLMEEHLNDAEEQARKADNPNRALQVVAEMKKRHDFAMNPKGNRFVAAMSNLAFVWYLGSTPAAALANISQTTVVGIPLMSARFEKVGLAGVAKALGRASKDFVAGRGKVTSRVAGVPVWTDQWTAENSPSLTPDERAALAEAVRRGTIDKTQAHDLASAAEHGIEYNATREKWMKRIGFFFHHAERFNREITFLASYRLAKAEGLDQAAAVDAAGDLTFKIHFDMQNNSRPRFMQNDVGKVLTTFRQFTVNMLWRLFRDSHQALNGATKEDRREARLQLVGLSLSMMAHAGIRGVWGYGLLMMLLGMLAPGADDDDIKEWMQEALLMQGDSAGVAAWNFTMGAALNGVPGQVLGIDLTDRIGMPNLWFRDAPNDLEGGDLYSHYVMEVLGPAVGVGGGFFRGAQLASEGEWWRGTEAAVPKAVRDAMKSARYMGEGVQTLNGDTLVEELSPYQALVQAIGFTPAEIAERYDINSRLKDRERQITGERSDIQKAAAKAILAGEDIPADVLAQIGDFNTRYPEYPITGDTIRQSARSKKRALDRSEYGVVLNAKLNDRLRAERATPIGR